MTGAARILVVDDDRDIRELLGRYLATQGFEPMLAADARECEACLSQARIDLVVLDVMLPDASGLDMCREIRGRPGAPAVILLTALKEDVDRIIGLELGADDYLGKPFNPRELAARIRAVLRRGPLGEGAADPSSPAGRVFRFEGYEVDEATRHVVDAAGTAIPLTGAEFDLLLIFLERPSRVLSRETLLDLLHGRVSADPFDRTIDVTMSRLRRKFGDNGVFRLFKTVRNGGYQFACRVEQRSP